MFNSVASSHDRHQMKLRPRLPVLLKTEPFVEGLWELHFQSSNPTSTELLAGVLFQSLKQDYPGAERLPTASIPREIKEKQKHLTFMPSLRLNGRHFRVNVGDRSIGVIATRPYAHWAAFRAEIDRVLSVVEGTNLIETVQEFLLKYTNCLVEPVHSTLGATAIKLAMAEREFKAEALQLRVEFTELGLSHSLQLAMPADVNVPSTGEDLHGMVIDLATHCDHAQTPAGMSTRAWVMSRLDEVHTANKTIFFSLLADETLELLAPTY